MSYEWGLPGNDEPTLFLNKIAVRVRKNLYDGLVAIRDQQRDLSIWIDALCINQADTSERGHQVGIMGKIFRSAKKVLIWLGPERDGSDIAMDRIATEARPDFTRDTVLNEEEARSLSALWNRPYWNRVWIQQEIHLATDYTVYCGTKFLPRKKFMWSKRLIVSLHRIRGIKWAMTLNAAWFILGNDDVGNPLSLWLRVSTDLGFMASEPRDYIYAFLGIACDCQEGQIVPDYHKGVLEVYLEALTICNNPSKLESWRLERLRETARALAVQLGLSVDETLERLVKERVGLDIRRRPIWSASV